MTIQTFSPLQGSGAYYLNYTYFESKLMFTDSNPILNYMVCRFDDNDNVWKVIGNGKLNGYLESSTYNYKIDLYDYILIEHYRDFELTNFIVGSDEVQWQELPKYRSKVSLVLSETNIFNANVGNFIYKANGEIWLAGSYKPFDLNDTTVYDYTFLDKADGDSIPFTDSPIIYLDKWFPLTVYTNQYDTRMLIYNKFGGVIRDFTFNSLTENTPILFMIYIPLDAARVEMWNAIDPLDVQRLNCEARCGVNTYYYWSVNGNLDIIYCDANTHEVDNITKNYITVNGVRKATNVVTQKQLKVNTGFKLKQEQIYSLIKSPFAMTFGDVSIGTSGKNYINNSQTMTIVNNPIVLDLNPSVYLVNDIDYILSIESSELMAGSATQYTVEVVETSSNTIAFTFTWNIGLTKQYQLFTSPATGNYSIKLYPGIKGSTTGRTVKFNHLKLEYDKENVLIYENRVGKLWLMEKGGISTVWVPSLTDTKDKIIKRYLIDTTTFEGWVGSKYSEKNIELLLTDEKNYRRKTNINLTFWD